MKVELLLCATLLTSVSAFSGTLVLSRAQMKEAWPFTVERGTLKCTGGFVTFEVGNKTYAVNGSAKTKGLSIGWVDVAAIWRDNPEIPGTKISIGPVISKGLVLCQ
ncbi:DUF2511 domain-containing protein [Rhodoferax sp.]|uniref:DUF2511 domain-containing protein n=1 Tax=Rhodoferax sp. TaxID=50421 RepID=UPI0026168302|nr:DUF2511 domain-containing protein [Rhodoferax sp.]MDD2811013.1 DUF2511 domain-containing protein [Rhodoferax sp.]